MAVGDRIKLAREAMGWNQERLAEALGVETPTISRWENGVHGPRPKHWPRIVAALGRTREWFEADDLSAIEQRLQRIESRSTFTPSMEDSEIISAWSAAAREPVRRALAMFFLTGDHEHLKDVPEEFRRRLLAGLKYFGAGPAKKQRAPTK